MKSPKRKQSAKLSSCSIPFTKQALEDVRRADRLYELVANGGERDISKIKELLDRDPKKFMRDRNDPGHLINQHSWNRQTPLYVACKYGNKKMVKFLLSEHADPHLTNETTIFEANHGSTPSRWTTAGTWMVTVSQPPVFMNCPATTETSYCHRTSSKVVGITDAIRKWRSIQRWPRCHRQSPTCSSRTQVWFSNSILQGHYLPTRARSDCTGP